MRKNNKGITLIALIVTVIILIIIAGISIASLTSDNGILRQTNTAKVEQIEGTAREQVKLAVSAMRLAIAEASSQDNSYRADNNTGKIQAKLVEILNQDKNGLNGEFGFGGNDLADDATGTELKLNYIGDDYQNACNDENALITYTIKLGQKSIELIGEGNTLLKDESGKDVVINIGGYLSSEELVATGAINIDSNGVLTTAYDETAKTSSSADVISGQLVIPRGVTSIGKNAFKGCTNLTSVIIPEGVTTLDESAFFGCTNLTEVIIPNSVTKINGWAFELCSNLTSVTLPEGTTNIGNSAFAQCTKLESINIPETVTSIGQYAFYKCTSLNSVIIPDSVTSIGNTAFGQSGITNVILSKNITELSPGVFSVCEYLKSLSIPEGVTVIGNGAVNSCPVISEITIPKTVTIIDKSAFWNTTSLTKINFGGTVAEWNAIEFGQYWNAETGNYTVYCTDGTVSKI